MTDPISGFLTNNLAALSQQRSDRYRELASGGTAAPWYAKTAAQVQTHISSTNITERIEAFDTFTASAEGVLRTQVAGIEQLMNMAQKIRADYLPGRYATTQTVPGFTAEVTMLRDSIYNALTLNFGENGYVFGGNSTFNTPIQDIRNTTIFPGIPTSSNMAASDFSYATPGTLKVYINENGDTLNLDAITASSPSVVKLINSLMLLANSTNGRDAQAAAASEHAETAYELLTNDYHAVLQQLNFAMAKKDDREAQKMLVTDINGQMNSSEPEQALADIHRINMLETANQEILLQQQKMAQKAARLMEKASG